MKPILTFLIVFTINIQTIFSQQNYANPYYIWAKNGLSLRKSPNKTAEKITVIPYKSEVSLISYSEETLTITEFTDFNYTSNWAKIKYKDIVGYSFMGYISVVKPPKISENYTLEQYLNDCFTKTNTTILSKYENCASNDESCVTSGVYSYKEGISYSFWNGEGGGTDSLSIPNFNILQAFTLASIFCPSYTDFEIKYFENPQPTIIVLRDDVGCDFSITVLGDFTIIHWSGGC